MEEKQEEVRRRKRIWAMNNPEKVRAASAKWRAANLEKARAASAKWKAANPDSASQYRGNAKIRKSLAAHLNAMMLLKQGALDGEK